MYLRLNIRREIYFLWLYTVLYNTSTISSGAAMGYSTVALPVLTNNTSSITLSATEMSLFASIILFSQVSGPLFCLIPMANERLLGRISSGVTSTLGWILIACSYTVTQLFVGRVLTGISIGLSFANVVVYLEEISTPSCKRVIPNTEYIFNVLGTLLVYLLGFLLQDNWKLIAAICAIPAICFLLSAIFVIPESPVWLLTKGRKEAARISLLRIRGLRQETLEFRREFTEMEDYAGLRNEISKTSAEEVKKESIVWNKLRNIRTICLPEVWKPLVIVNLYFIFQQFSGLFVIIAYAVDFIVKVKIIINPFLVTAITEIIQFVCTVITMCCSTKFGYRNLSIISGSGMAISIAILGVYMQFFVDTNISTVPLVCIFAFMVFGSIGLSLPYVLIAELYPTKCINIFGSFTVFVSTLLGYLILELYPTMITHIKYATFYFYCTFCIIGTIFLTIALPDTRGKTKRQIEDAFRSNSRIEGEDACQTSIGRKTLHE